MTWAFFGGVALGTLCGLFWASLLVAGKQADIASNAYHAGQKAERERRRREDLGIIDLKDYGVGSDGLPDDHTQRGA